MSERIWLDTDPGMGVAGSDVDDGLAILLALGSPELRLEALSITFGNVPLERGLECGRRVLAAAGHDVPVHAGASSAREHGQASPAAEALIAAADAAPGEITLVAIGPLTNVATAMQLDPDLARKLRRLVVMGGALRFPHYAEHGEFNFHQDGRAAAAAMAAPCPRALVTMDLCAQATFRREHLDAMLTAGGPVADLLRETVPDWLRLWQDQWNLPGFFPWDPVAVAYLTHPELFDGQHCGFDVDSEGERQGRIRNVHVLPAGVHGVEVPSRLDGDAFLALLVERIARVAEAAAGA